MELNGLEEIRLDAYEGSKIYKEKMKMWHNKLVNRRKFRERDLVLLVNFILKLFHNKLRSRWSGPFKVLKVNVYGPIEIRTKATGLLR